MSPETTQYLVFGVLAAALAGTAAYFIARWLKGSLNITLSSHSYGYGGVVAGSLALTARKEIKGNRLFAALVLSETRRERDMRGRSRSHTREIWRTEATLDGEKVYPAGHSANYDFKLQIPQEPGGGFGDSVLGQAAEFLIGGGRRLSWRVEARLDAEGVDLASSRRISVGGSGGFFGI